MLTSEQKELNYEKIVPVIHDETIFAGHENEKFAIGVFNSESIANYNDNPIVKAYLQLRANVYVDQTNILGSEAKNHDGIEIDEDDERSAHFIVCEKKLGGIAVFAAMRMIKKSEEDDLLPVEEDFDGGLFEPVEKGSLEISRFIVRNSERSAAIHAKSKLIMAGLAYALANNTKPLNIYAEVELPFRRSLRAFGVATDLVSNPQLFEEGGFDDGTIHNTELVAIKIGTEVLEQKFGSEVLKSLVLDHGQFSYWGEADKDL